VPDAYERLIMDVIRGNQTLFMRGDEVEAAWAWTDPIIEGWTRRGDRPVQYEPGSSGPEEALDAAAPGRAALAGDWRMNLIEYPDRDF
jgi:glucose-6-phosphate 1-dehydrogenase